MRTATSDVSLHGTTIPEGARVAMVIGAANHDDRQYRDPHVYDALRPAVRHLGFGEGLHGCLGNPLARLEARVALEVALPRFGEFLVSGTPARYPSTPNMAVLDHLPVAFEVARPLPAPASAARVQVGLQHTPDTSLRTLVVREHVAVADGVAALVLGTDDCAELPAWEPGAHVDLLLGNGLTRQYSLCGDPADRDTYRVGVLREDAGGGGSRFVHDELRPGSTVPVRAPRNHFRLEPAPHYVFVAGGIGVTPILTMIGAAQAAGAVWTLLYGGRRRASMAFLGELERHGDRVTVWPQDTHGLLELDALLGEPRADTLVYACGPGPLLDAVEARCEGWPPGALHIERFAAAPLTTPVRDEPFEVELARTGRVLTVPTDRSVVEVVEAETGMAILTSCSEGKCGTCETGVLEGTPDHRDVLLTPVERAACDRMMICVSRSCSERLVLDL